MGRTVCIHGKLDDGNCTVCQTLAKYHHAIQLNQVLGEAWARVRQVPVVKSMHPAAREAIQRALMGE